MANTNTILTNGFFDPPAQYELAPNPPIYFIRAKSLQFNVGELKSGTPRWVKADRRADEVKLILRHGFGSAEESLEFVLPHSKVPMKAPLCSGQNYWTNVHRWVYKKDCTNRPLSMMFLSEDHLGHENLSMNVDTYVEFAMPDVVVVIKGDMKSDMPLCLSSYYQDRLRVELLGGGDLVLWFYYDSKKFAVHSRMDFGFGYVFVKRVEPIGESSVGGEAEVAGQK